MATSTKESLGNALKKMLTIKPIDKITVKDLVEECGVNRQTFYYHFDDVYDLLEWVFEEDANRTLPQEILYENWLDRNMELPPEITEEKFIKVLDGSIESMLSRFQKN